MKLIPRTSSLAFLNEVTTRNSRQAKTNKRKHNGILVLAPGPCRHKIRIISSRFVLGVTGRIYLGRNALWAFQLLRDKLCP